MKMLRTKKWIIVPVANSHNFKCILSQVCDAFGCELILPPAKYCTDNGVMIAWNGYEKWIRGSEKDLVPWDKVFELECFPRSPFGTNICEEVRKAHIKCNWVPL